MGLRAGAHHREQNFGALTQPCRGVGIKDDGLQGIERLVTLAVAISGKRNALTRGIAIGAIGHPSLVDLLGSRHGSRSADLGGGVRAVREYETLRLEGTVEWGPWSLATDRDDLEVRTRRPGDRLAGRRKKVQDLLVDAKVPRARRDEWPVVVRAGEVVAVPGIAEAPGYEGAVVARRRA